MSALNRTPDLSTIGGRLKAERIRLGLTQPEMGRLVGMTKSAQIKWENGRAFPNAEALAAFARVGADILFIVIGNSFQNELTTPEPIVRATVRQALAMLDPVDRRRLLLDLLADELAA